GVASALAERRSSRLPAPGEPAIELVLAAIAQERDAAGEGETAMRALAVGRVVVVAVAEARVRADRLDLQGAQRDLVGGRHGGAGEHREALETLRVHDGPLERLHRAHRAADDRGPALDAEPVGERRLRAHLIADRDVGEAGTPFA